MVYGAAPAAESLIRQAHERLGCGLYQAYGISEGVSNLTGLLPEDHDRAVAERPELLASCGRVVPGVRIETHDENGAPTAAGEVGEIWVKSEKVMAGYWRDPEQTAEALVDGWLRTGDRGRFDDEGYLYIAGRSKDMLISGGVNVYPREIETVLCDHPAVSEAAVVGRPDPEWGERPVAFVELRPEKTLDGLFDWCRQRLAKIKIPRRDHRRRRLPPHRHRQDPKSRTPPSTQAPVESPCTPAVGLFVEVAVGDDGVDAEF